MERLWLLLALAGYGFLTSCASVSTVADLKMSLEDDQLIVHPANELGRFRWSFDTGSDLTLFDAEALAEVDLIATDATAVISGTTGRKIEGPIEILPELPLEQRGRTWDYPLRDLWVVRVPGLRKNTGFDAILGYQPFQTQVVELELGMGRVRVKSHLPQRRGIEYHALQFDEWRPVMVVPASTGYRFPAIVDTGSNSWFSLTKADRKALKISEAIERGRLTRGALGETTHSLYQFDGSISLGNAYFRNPIVTGTDRLTESLLGVPALRYVRVTLDPVTGRAGVEVPSGPWGWLGRPPRIVTITTILTPIEELKRLDAEAARAEKSVKPERAPKFARRR